MCTRILSSVVFFTAESFWALAPKGTSSNKVKAKTEESMLGR
jgi:hypothetical protein